MTIENTHARTGAVPGSHAESYLLELGCGLCDAGLPADTLQQTCPADARPLLARYDLDQARRELDRDALERRTPSLWQWAELLPVRDPAHRLSLSEGGTPLLALPAYGERVGLRRLLAKDEGRNPTGAFKARGMAVAVSRARELGATVLSAPSAGNAGAALAAYAARGGLDAIVAMPMDAPASAITGAVRHGARVLLVDGLINDAGALLRALAPETGAFDLSTLKEPYRVEGKKTMGLELALQLGWRLPDVIVYPTGGGTGLVGMWKAFAELEALGWIGPERPRMVSVQSTGCAPITRAFEAGERFAEPWQDARTIAAGVRVPVAIGDFLILDALRESGGTAVSVTDEEILVEEDAIARIEGLDVSHEAAATLAGVRRLVGQRLIQPDEEVVVFLTGSGLLEERERTALQSVAPEDLAAARRILAQAGSGG